MYIYIYIYKNLVFIEPKNSFKRNRKTHILMNHLIL